ncbi:alpha/beta hydrolase [Emticicia fluvialis]|uniref:alpha/beta hydrolase n=1 Tax=Emticicia fluvialis TaxID=2974474 RepID=UPI002165FFF9|nr:alpha/beta hydrolase [Emticicia fluvialis]
MKTMHLLLAFLCLVSVAPVQAGSKSHSAQDSTYKQYVDLRYGPAEGTANLLDLYLPKNNSSTTKLIVYVHGGSWKWGSKNDFPKLLVGTLTAKGYGVVALNYRLLKEGSNRFPAQMEDLTNAFAFLTVKAGQYGFNGREFALLGVSAGAHLSLLYTYKHDKDRQIKTVIDIVGPTDLTDADFRKGKNSGDIINQFLGNANPDAPVAVEASPILQINKDNAVPVIIFHGESDELVPVQQAKALHKKYQDLGGQSQLVLYPGETHEMRKSLFDVYTKLAVWLQRVFPAR